VINSGDDNMDELETDVEASWMVEIRRRDEDLRNGRATVRPAEEVLRETHDRLQQG
jgi:hypothetical protein